MNYFIKEQKWANQFPEIKSMSAEEIYVILYMLSLFQNNKSYQVIRMSHYTSKCFNEFLTGGGELGSHFIISNGYPISQKIPKVLFLVQI